MEISQNGKLILGYLLLVFFLCSIHAISQKPKKPGDKPLLIFQSGFEGNTSVVKDVNTNDHGSLYEHIAGVDNTFKTKSNWDKDWMPFLSTGVMQVQYTGGDSSKRFANIIPEPGNSKNHVLYFWLNDSWLASEGQKKARIQTNLYGMKTGLKEFYQSERVFLHPDFNALKSYPKIVNWLTLSEFWNNEWWSVNNKNGFRFSVSIYKVNEGEGELYFKSDSQDPGMKEVWKEINTNVKVPVGKWFTMDYYFKEGDKETGRFYVSIKVDGEPKQVVFDIHNITHNTTDKNPDGLTDYNPMKLYTSKELVDYMRSKSKTLQIYWDDFKLWTNKRPE